MILPDSNIWVAISFASHDFYDAASNWFSAQTAPSSICFCRATQLAFLRLITTDSIIRRYKASAVTNIVAWEWYEKLLADPRITTAEEPTGIQVIWKSFSSRRTASSKLWMDAYLAAFAVAGSHSLVTTDQAFSQFDGLNPIILKP